MKYPLAKNGIFLTIQGEGVMLGTPMVFVRLAGCSIGCPQCDTDYRVNERLTAREIAQRVKDVRGSSNWVWITGGEPTDHELLPLLESLPGKIALATSGEKSFGDAEKLVDFLSVSPHGLPSKLLIDRGSQINLVPGLNGLDLRDWNYFNANRFANRYVTPLYGHSAEQIAECIKFVEANDGWKLGVQAHKIWGIA